MAAHDGANRITFDCHGMTYQDVMDKFENWLWLNQNNTPLEVITGSSAKMKMIITRLLEHNEMKYAIPAHNQGMVIILQWQNNDRRFML